MKRLQIVFLLAGLCLLPLSAAGQSKNIIVKSAYQDTIDNVVLDNLVGQGVYVYNIKFNNHADDITYPQIGTFNSNGFLGLQMDSGLVITTGKVSVAAGPNNSGSYSEAPGNIYSDTKMNTYASGSVTDCGTLDFDFVSMSPFVTVNYCFGSEEYPEYVCSGFNDVFAFLVTGPDPSTGVEKTWNTAIIPYTISSANPNGIAVAINSVNVGKVGSNGSASTKGCYTTYSDFYVDNTSTSKGIQYDGYTQKLSANATLMPCQKYHMHISVCNVGDQGYDSGVFLEYGSFNSPRAEVQLSHRYADTLERSKQLTLPLTLDGTDYDTGFVSVFFGGNATVGQDYTVVTDSGKVLSTIDNTFILDKNPHSLTFRGTAMANLAEPKLIELYLMTALCPQYPQFKTYDTVRYLLVEDDLLRLRHDTIIGYDTCHQVSVDVALGTPPFTFHWMPEDGIDFPYQQVSSATITESHLYQVAAADSKGHTDTTDIYVQILPKDPDPIAVQEAVQAEVSIYPNPTDGPLTVEAAAPVSVEVYAADGRKVRSATCDGTPQVLHFDGLSAGLYTLRITTPWGIKIEKVVVN